MIDQSLALPEAVALAVQGFFAAYLHRPFGRDPHSSFEVNELSGGMALGAVQALVLGDLNFQEFFNNGAATVKA